MLEPVQSRIVVIPGIRPLVDDRHMRQRTNCEFQHRRIENALSYLFHASIRPRPRLLLFQKPGPRCSTSLDYPSALQYCHALADTAKKTDAVQSNLRRVLLVK